MRIGMQLKLARTESGWTMDRLSKLSGIAKSSISEIEAGKTNPQTNTIDRLVECFGCELRIVKKGE